MSKELEKAFKDKLAQIKAENITQADIDRTTAAMKNEEGRKQAAADLLNTKSDRVKH